jgi:hypothetical protein
MDDQKDKQYKRFKKIDESWRQDMLGRQTEEVYKVITKTAMNDIQLALAKQFDEDLNKLKEQVKEAGAIYSEGHKMNVLQLEFLCECLRSRGENVPGIEDFLKDAANAVNGQTE